MLGVQTYRIQGTNPDVAATRDGRPHRWVNPRDDESTVFITTTSLDFVTAFARPEMRELASLSLLRDCQRYDAKLHAFVVMPHHLHLLATAPSSRNMSWLVQRMKSNLAKLTISKLSTGELGKLSALTGLNRRSLWQPSFRGLPISTTDTFYQKVRYIHINPIRDELCQEPGEYRWSSRRFWDQELWIPESGLDLVQALRGFDESISTDVSDL